MGSLLAYAARGAALFLTAAAVMPRVRSHHWAIRAFDFPRLQLAAAAGACAAVGLARFRRLSRWDRRLLGLLAAAVAAQAVEILPYTPLGRKEVAGTDGEPDLRILAANVLQSNRRSDLVLAQIAAARPDVVLLTETDERWQRDLTGLARDYPHSVARPQGNTYGMMLLSKLELVEPEVRFLVKPDIPSIRTRLRLRDGRLMWLYAVHPEPPGLPNRNGKLQSSGPRDVELLVLAEELAELKQPVVVAGDFNDVAWSHTTRLFKRLSRLLDPRRGRGMFNSFHADYPPLRYPLDHLFHSEHLVLSDFRRLGWTGSDHFPIYAALKLSPEAAAVQEQAAPKARDFEEADETIAKAPIE